MRVKLSVILIIPLFISCSIKKIPQTDSPIKIENAFNNEAVQWFKTKGEGAIKGVAKFKSGGGELRYGKDFRIELMPYCSYSEERLGHIYKKKKSGFVHVESGIPKFTPDPEGYHETIKVMCNEAGEFEFKDLPAGEYYVIAFMLWEKTGGGIMRRLKLSEGEVKSIEMMNF